MQTGRTQQRNLVTDVIAGSGLTAVIDRGTPDRNALCSVFESQRKYKKALRHAERMLDLDGLPANKEAFARFAEVSELVGQKNTEKVTLARIVTRENDGFDGTG